MNVNPNAYRLILIAVFVLGLLGVMANASTNPGFYLHSQQNISTEGGQYYTLFAQAGSHIISYAPYPVPVIYNYQWYNTTDGHMNKIAGANSRTLSGISGGIGTYTYEVVATNQQGVSVSNSSTLTVTNLPSISLSAGSMKLDQGESYRFRSFYAPGAGNASYIWNATGLKLTAHCLYPANSTCTISTEGVAPGVYNVSLLVKDGTEQRYMTSPVMAQVQVNAAPTVIATPDLNQASKGNVTYMVTIVNGTGPFNVSLYATDGTRVANEKIPYSNDTELMFFTAPSQTIILRCFRK